MGYEHLASLRRSTHALRRRTDAALAALGLSTADFELLSLVWRHEVLEQRNLVNLLGVSRATAHTAIASLHKRGLLRISTSDADGRVQLIVPTLSGWALREAAERAWQMVDRAMLRGFTAPERARLVELLDRLSAALATEDGGNLYR